MDVGSVTQQGVMLFDKISLYVNTLVIGLVILLGGFILGRIVDLVLYKSFLKLKFDDRCYAIFGVRRNYARATRNTLVYAIYVLTLYFTLKQLRLNTIAITLVLGLLLIIAFVSAIFAGIEVIPHFVGRWRLHQRGITEGVRIEVQDVSGTVKGVVDRITLSDFQIKRPGGDVLSYPNAMVPGLKIRRVRPAQSRTRQGKQ